MSDALSDVKLSLPSFLQILTCNNISASKAMAIAGKIYKVYNTPSSLALLTDSKLRSAGVEDKDERKLVLAAIKKAGYSTSALNTTNPSTALGASSASRSRLRAKSSANHSGTTLSQPGESRLSVRRKRRRDDDLNEFLPDHAPEAGESYGSLEFKEILDEEVLMSKSTISNRAPIMTLWSFIVAERLGFQREEALSIATVYTEMNAISKGISLGIYNKGNGNNLEATKGGTQPYVDLMGRRPLYQTSAGQWRALSKGTPVSPSAAFSYVNRTLLQTTPQIVGALRLLAESYSPSELNDQGYALYKDFRPDVDGWGQKGEVKCSTIMALRKQAESGETKQGDRERSSTDAVAKIEFTKEEQDKTSDANQLTGEGEGVSAPKKARGMTLEEYEAALDADDAFDGLDFDGLPGESTSRVESDAQ